MVKHQDHAPLSDFNWKATQAAKLPVVVFVLIEGDVPNISRLDHTDLRYLCDMILKGVCYESLST